MAARFQTTQILNANTVAPRVTTMAQSFERRIWRARRPDRFDPLDLVVDLSEPQTILTHYGKPYGEEQIRLTDEQVKAWERDVLVRVRVALEHATKSPENDWLHFILQAPEPQGVYPVAGFAEIEGWDAVRGSPA